MGWPVGIRVATEDHQPFDAPQCHLDDGYIRLSGLHASYCVYTGGADVVVLVEVVVSTINDGPVVIAVVTAL